MKVLLIGGSGQLGTQIQRRWTHDRIVAPPHAELGIEDTGALEARLAAEPADVAINCAAFHNVDTCESEPERAFAVNALAVGRAADACERRGTVFVTMSTDYVFDGSAGRAYTEDDCPRPVSVYGASKLAGEHLALRRDGRAIVVRTCGIYGTSPSRSKGHTFIDRLISQAAAGDPIRVVHDVVASPTYAGHLAEALRGIVTREPGIYHACNRGPVSWYDFARGALDEAGFASYPIEAISSSEWKAAARRPQYSALANDRLDALGIAMPDWRAGIAAYLSDKEKT
jgi:dTDP-4-dehydrorhamnose reductase